MNIPSSMRGCEAHGVCFAEAESCATGHCAQANAARVYSDLNLPSADHHSDPALEQARDRIRKLDEKTAVIALWFGFCCLLFWLATVGTTVLIYKMDAQIRAWIGAGVDHITQLAQWLAGVLL